MEKSPKVNGFIIIVLIVCGYRFTNDVYMISFDDYIYILFWDDDFTMVLGDTPSGV